MIRLVGDGVAVDVLVAPRASRPRIGPVHDNRIKVAVTSPPVEGAANKAVALLFARALGLARSHISVTSGATSRRKTLTICGIAAEAVAELVRDRDC